MHFSTLIVRASENVGRGEISLRLDPLELAARDLDCDDPELIARAKTAVAETLSKVRRAEVEPDSWTSGLAGWDSFQIAAALAAAALTNPPKELTA